jgi:hypothetical protein
MVGDSTENLLDEQAAEIERLQAENGRLSVALKASEALKSGYIDEVQRLQTTNEKLRAALEEIARSHWTDSAGRDVWTREAIVARAALALNHEQVDGEKEEKA